MDRAASYLAELGSLDLTCKATGVSTIPRDEQTQLAQRLVDTLVKGFRLMLTLNSHLMEFISLK